MYGIVLVMALSDGALLPNQGGCCGCYGGYYYSGCYGGCYGGFAYSFCPIIVQPGTTQQSTGGGGGGQQAVKITRKEWPEPVKKRVKNTLENKGLADPDVDTFIDQAQTFGCKGGDFEDFLNVPGLKTQKGDGLKEALRVYMVTLKGIAQDPSPKKWPDNVTKKVKTNLERKGLADPDVDAFVDQAQAFGCKGGDFDNFLSVPGLNAQRGDAFKEALQVYMKTLKSIRQGQSSKPAPARIYVSVPADAKLTIDDAPTLSTSANRVFVTPALERDREFYYTFKVEIVRNGKAVVASKRVAVRAGLDTRVRLEVPTSSDVASTR